MMKRCLTVMLLVPLAVAGLTSSAGLDPAAILKPLGESWPTYSGDYTGRRHSSLTQINQATVKSLGGSRGQHEDSPKDRARRGERRWAAEDSAGAAEVEARCP
jgi:hypothetical protein